MIGWARSLPDRSTHVDDHSHSAGTNPDACTSTITSLIAGTGSGTSMSVMPAASADRSVATIAFTRYLHVPRAGCARADPAHLP